MRPYRLLWFGFVVLGSTIVLVFAASGRRVSTTAAAPAPPGTYLGFDLNIYPGDDAMPILRKTFSFTSYWLGPPPGEKRSTWQGKRELRYLRSQEPNICMSLDTIEAVIHFTLSNISVPIKTD